MDADGGAGDAGQLALPRDLGVWSDPIRLAVAEGLCPQGVARPAAAFGASRGTADRADKLWAKVQQRLASEPKPVGRRPKDGNQASRPRLLNGLFRCPTHDRPLYVGGPHGHMMFCKACKELNAGKRPLFSQLSRALALRLTCQAARQAGPGRRRAGGDDHRRLPRGGRAGEPASPGEVEELRRRIQRAERQIKFLLENAGETDSDRRESADQLREQRRSRGADAAELVVLEASQDRPVVVPEEVEVRALLDDLGRILEEAATDSGEGQGAAREVIELLTGGRIDLEQQGERKSHRGWLRGRLRVDLVHCLAARAGQKDLEMGGEGVEVVIDYREPTETEALAEPAKALFDEGLLVKEIADRLGALPSLVAKALAHWHESRGLPVPDGRSRRKSLDRKHVEPPLFERLAGEAKQLYDEGLLNGEIAKRLGCDINTVTRSIAFWFSSRSLPVPDGRTRRKSLARKTRPA